MARSFQTSVPFIVTEEKARDLARTNPATAFRTLWPPGMRICPVCDAPEDHDGYRNIEDRSEGFKPCWRMDITDEFDLVHRAFEKV